MRNLLKTDLKRIIKDKLFLISCIIAGAYSVLSPVLYKVMFAMIGADDKMLEAMGAAPSAKSMLFQALVPGGDLGLIIPILIIIALCKDFSYGTIRNKIIAGHSRAKIFISMFITSVIIMFSIMLAQALLSFFVSLALFSYSAQGFEASEILYLIVSIVLELIVYITVCSIICFFCVFMKNPGTSVVMFFAVNFTVTMVGSIIMIASTMATPGSTAASVLDVLYKSNIFINPVIGAVDSYTFKDLLLVLVPNLIFAPLITFFGYKVFNKKDLK